MRYLIVLMALSLFINSAFAQKKYVDPTERQKNGLMEEEDKVDLKSIAPITSAEPVVQSAIVGPQEHLCECVKLKSMNEQLRKVYWNTNDEVLQAVTSISEIDQRSTTVTETMVSLVVFHKDDKSPVNPAKCINLRSGQTNLALLRKEVLAQEKKCLIFDSSGAGND